MAASDPVDSEGPPRNAIVVGFGPVGRLVAEGLADAGCEVTILEANPETVEKQSKLGRKIVLGDACNAQDLRKAGLETAHTLVLTMPNEDVALRACETARAVQPDVFISARTNFMSKGLMAMKSGADHVVVEELVTAEEMRRAVVYQLTGDKPPRKG